jgi:hypothetical protein
MRVKAAVILRNIQFGTFPEELIEAKMKLQDV